MLKFTHKSQGFSNSIKSLKFDCYCFLSLSHFSAKNDSSLVRGSLKFRLLFKLITADNCFVFVGLFGQGRALSLRSLRFSNSIKPLKFDCYCFLSLSHFSAKNDSSLVRGSLKFHLLFKLITADNCFVFVGLFGQGRALSLRSLRFSNSIKPLKFDCYCFLSLSHFSAKNDSSLVRGSLKFHLLFKLITADNCFVLVGLFGQRTNPALLSGMNS